METRLDINQLADSSVAPDEAGCCDDGTCDECKEHQARVVKYTELAHGDMVTGIGLARLAEFGLLYEETVDGHTGIGLNHEAGHLFVALASIFGSVAMGETEELKSDSSLEAIRALATASAYRMVQNHVLNFIEDNAARMLVAGVEDGAITDIPDDILTAARERAADVERRNAEHKGWGTGVEQGDFADIIKAQRKREAEDALGRAAGTGGYL